ncbi:MAG: hotdog domain-containing protein [Balneolaceae bacterium]
MKFHTRKLVKPQDMNPFGTLFGGILLAWIDEEAAIFVSCQLRKQRIVTKYMSEIDFVHSATLGDIVEIGLETVAVGKSSITIRCEVRQKFSHKVIIRIEKIVFVHVDEEGLPLAHGKTVDTLGDSPSEHSPS